MKEIEYSDEDLALMMASLNDKALSNELGVSQTKVQKEKERLIREGYNIPSLRESKKKVGSLKREPFIWLLYKKLREEY